MAGRGKQTNPDPPGWISGDHILSDLNLMFTGDRNALQSIVDLFLTLYNKGEAHEIEVKNVASENEFLTGRVRVLESELRFLKDDYESLKHQLADIHDVARSMYLRLEGLGEEKIKICLNK